PPEARKEHRTRQQKLPVEQAISITELSDDPGSGADSSFQAATSTRCRCRARLVLHRSERWAIRLHYRSKMANEPPTIYPRRAKNPAPAIRFARSIGARVLTQRHRYQLPAQMNFCYCARSNSCGLIRVPSAADLTHASRIAAVCKLSRPLTSGSSP